MNACGHAGCRSTHAAGYVEVDITRQMWGCVHVHHRQRLPGERTAGPCSWPRPASRGRPWRRARRRCPARPRTGRARPSWARVRPSVGLCRESSSQRANTQTRQGLKGMVSRRLLRPDSNRPFMLLSSTPPSHASIRRGPSGACAPQLTPRSGRLRLPERQRLRADGLQAHCKRLQNQSSAQEAGANSL